MARSLTLATISLGFTAFAAQADIGGVGAPYQAQPQQAEASQQAAAQTAAPAVAQPATQAKPLIRINFTQNYLNYERAVVQGVAAAEQAKPGIVYEVVSYLPPIGDDRAKAERMSEAAQQNLQGVVQSIRAQGVPDSRIRVTAVTYPKEEGKTSPDYNQIAIFVK